MKKSLKMLLSFTLVLAVAFSFGSVFADDKKEIDKNKVGKQLKELGFIQGTENGLETENPITREQAVVVLSRLMDKEDEAKNFEAELTFKDIENEFYKPYIAYAVEQKWLTGRSEAEFGFAAQITGQEFAAMMLRALGYTEYKGDKYSEVPAKAEELGLKKDYELAFDKEMTRGDAFVMIRNELKAPVKDAKNGENLFETIFFAKYDKDNEKIVLIHTNDMHGFFQEGKYNGMGAAKLKRFIDLVEAKNPDALYVDAGDAVQGANLVTLSKGMAAIDVLEGLELDAMVLGNHEFDYGQEQLAKLVEKSEGKFPMLACNVLDKTGKPVYKPYVIKEAKGKKIAFVGFATPETTFKSHPKNTENLTFEDPVEAGKKIVKELEGKADILVGICHLGDEKLEQDWTSIKLAKNVPEFKVLVDGHSHKVYEGGKLVNGVMIVQAGEHTKNVGYVTIDPSDLTKPATSALFTKKDSAFINEDQKVAAIVDKIKKDNEIIEAEEIAESPVELIGEREVVRKGESNLGNLLTAALINISDADVALTNGGGIRDTIAKGMVKKGDILRVFPFGNTVKVIKLSGKDLKAALEHGFSVYPEANGGFPHVAGLTVKFDAKKEAGSRITEVLVAGKALDENKEYTLATNDFLVAGGDDYKMFKGKPVVAEYGALDEILIDFIKVKGFEDAKMTNWLEILNK